MFKIRFARLVIGVGVFLLAASSAQAFSTTMTSNYGGGILTTSDTVTVTVEFDSGAVGDIAILSVSVLFNDEIMAWHQGASASPTYAMYTGVRGSIALAELSTNLTLRTGTTDQILLDWSSGGLPAGTNTGGCGAYGTFPAVPGTPAGNACGLTMATLVFHVISQGGEAAFTLSNSSPGNLFQLGDNSNPENAVSGNFLIQTPAACAPGKTKRDFNCDGMSDMLFEVSTGVAQNNLLYVVLIDGLTSLDADFVGVLFPSEHAIASAQADDDQHADIVTRYDDTGPEPGLASIRSVGEDGLGPITVDSIRFMGTGGIDWLFVGVGDMDGNGVDDLVFENGPVGEHPGLIRIILQADGTEDPTWANGIKYVHPGFVPSGYTIRTIGDMDGDGWGDILVESTGGQLDALMMVDDGTGSGLPVVEFPRSEVVNLAFYVMNSLIFPLPGYNAWPAYAVTDAARFVDADNAADLILEGVSNPIPGMIAMIANDGSRTDYVFDGISETPDYLLGQQPDFEPGFIGNYDGLNQSDLSSIGDNGVKRVVLQGANGVERIGDGYPLALPIEYEDVD